MAKNQRKPAKRVFFVRRNTDDISALRNLFQNQKDLLDLYEGEFIGSVGAGESSCEGKSRAWIRGWEIGKEQHREAVECFERAREAGRKSAGVREAKQGTAQPEGGNGHRTTHRTEYRTTHRTPFGRTEHPSAESGTMDTGNRGEYGRYDGIRQNGLYENENHRDSTEHPSVTAEQVTEQVTEPSSIHHPSSSSHDVPLKMTLGVSAQAREHQNKQEEREDLDYREIEEDEPTRSPFLDIPGRGYRSDRSLANLPPLKPHVVHFPGMRAHA